MTDRASALCVSPSPARHKFHDGRLFAYESSSLRSLLLVARRASSPSAASTTDGSQTQYSSLLSLTLSGETSIGRNGNKYRVQEMGAKSAMPRPPFVRASKTP